MAWDQVEPAPGLGPGPRSRATSPASRPALPPGFEKRAPTRSAWATCWAVDLVLAAIFAGGATLVFGLAMAMFAHEDDDAVGGVARIQPWAATLTVVVGTVVAVCTLALGSGGRSMGHAFAELRADGPGGRPASVSRRLVRALVVVLPFVLLAWWSVFGAAALVALLWSVSWARPDRRGPPEWLSGVRDYSIELVRG
jgi:hypothetical protein